MHVTVSWSGHDPASWALVKDLGGGGGGGGGGGVSEGGCLDNSLL